MSDLRNLKLMQTANPGNRSLEDSIIVPEVQAALKAWALATTGAPPMLIGGLAFSFYCKPRYTQDIDLLFLADSYVPETVNGFKRIRAHSFEHQKTGVEIEVLNPQYLGLPMDMIRQVLKSCKQHSHFSIPSPEALIALKIMRLSLKDRADIEELLTVCNFNLAEWQCIPQIKRQAFEAFRAQEGI